MTRIAIDTFATRPPWNCGGVYEYTRELLNQFRCLAQEFDCDITALVGRNYDSLLEGLQDTCFFRAKRCESISRPRFWRYGGCGLEARRLHSDTVLLPTPDVLPFLMPRYAVMIHDVPFLATNRYSSFKNWRFQRLTRMVAGGARLVLANSEYTKADIVRHLRVAPEKITVTYLSYNPKRFNTAMVGGTEQVRVLDKWKLQRPYILHHGTLQPRKNLVRLIEAYARLLQQHPKMDADLVLVGMRGWSYEDILKAANSVPAAGRVVVTGSVEEEELAVLVKGAVLSVIPSLYEGFCLPMLESMACGIPTVVANNSCLPEISGGVLRYFDAESVDQIAETIWTVLQSSSEQQLLREAGLRRAAEFSWERCARETLRALQQISSPEST